MKTLIFDQKDLGGSLQRDIGEVLVNSGVNKPQISVIEDFDSVISCLDEGGVAAVVTHGDRRHAHIKELNNFCQICDVPLYILGEKDYGCENCSQNSRELAEHIAKDCYDC